jgi:hypothetical protein
MLVLAAELLINPAAQAEDSAPFSVKVTGVTGSARYVYKNHQDWTALRIGDDLVGAPGLVLQTNLKDSTADIELKPSNNTNRVAIHLYPNTVLRRIQAGSKKSHELETADELLDVGAGQIKVSFDATAEHTFALISGNNSTRVTIPRVTTGPTETAFLFNGSLTVLKGTVRAWTAGGKEEVIRGAESHDTGTRAPVLGR